MPPRPPPTVQLRPFLSGALLAIRTRVLSVLRTLLTTLLLLLRELRDRAYMVLLISLGSGLIAADIRPGSGSAWGGAWGVGMVVFGGLSLYLRHHGTDHDHDRADPDPD